MDLLRRPHVIPCADNQGICVALAYNQLANVAVATFRGKPSVHQPEAPIHASEVESVEPIGISSQANSQLSLGFHPLRATHYPLMKSAAGHDSCPAAVHHHCFAMLLSERLLLKAELRLGVIGEPAGSCPGTCRLLLIWEAGDDGMCPKGSCLSCSYPGCS